MMYFLFRFVHKIKKTFCEAKYIAKLNHNFVFINIIKYDFIRYQTNISIVHRSQLSAFGRKNIASKRILRDV